MFELVHVLREQNARVDLLAKLASSSKGDHQRSVIQETLKPPKTIAGCTVEVQQVETLEGGRRGQRLLTKETLKVPKVSAYDFGRGIVGRLSGRR